MRTNKAGLHSLEIFEDGIEGLLHYYRSRRMLASCALLPLLAGAICTAEKGAFVLFSFALLFLSKSGLNRSTDLAVHGTEGSYQDKGGMTHKLLWEDVRHHLAGIVFVLLATSAALAWQENAGMDAAEIRLRQALQLSYVFLFCSMLFFRFSLSDISINARGLLFYVVFIPYAGGIGLLAGSSFDVLEYLSPSGSEAYSPPALTSEFLALRLAYVIPILFAALVFWLLWLGIASHRDRLLHLTCFACEAAWAFVCMSYFFVCRMPLTFFFYIDDAWILQEPTLLMWLGALFLLAAAVAASWARTFLQCEKIKRGMYFDIPIMMQGKDAPKSFQQYTEIFTDRVIRTRITQAGKPLLGSARRWRRVRLVTSLGERPWLAGLLSSFAAACYFLLS